jgi:hypothetical protein
MTIVVSDLIDGCVSTTLADQRGETGLGAGSREHSVGERAVRIAPIYGFPNKYHGVILAQAARLLK